MTEADYKKSKLRFEEWAKYANEDEQMVKIALEENGPPNQICFHSQQMAEKYLKGFLVFFKKRFEKKHQLDYLLNLCQEINQAFIEITKDIKYLTEFYIETRYPGDIQEFSLDEAQEAFEAAKRIKEFILGKIQQ